MEPYQTSFYLCIFEERSAKLEQNYEYINFLFVFGSNRSKCFWIFSYYRFFGAIEILQKLEQIVGSIRWLTEQIFHDTVTNWIVPH